MKRYVFVIALAAASLIAGSAAWAQFPNPGGAQQGFTVETLLNQISLYIPEDQVPATAAFGRGGQGGTGGQGTQGAQGSAGTARTGQAAGAGQNLRQLFQFKRDTKLYLTKDQIGKLIPVLQGLKDNPVPTPSKAKSIQASVDGILTVAQKAEYAEYQKQMQKALDEMRKQFQSQSGGTGTGAGAGATGGGTAQGGGFGGQGADANGQQRAAPTQAQIIDRRKAELDAWIKVLQDRQKQL
jgi:hypothetical protein